MDTVTISKQRIARDNRVNNRSLCHPRNEESVAPRHTPKQVINMEDQRNFSRIKFTAHCKIEIDGHPYGCELLDISLKGALIGSSEKQLPLAPGGEATIKILLPASSIAMNFLAELVHLDSEQNLYGFKFFQYDAESITHLRRLLEYNLDDHTLVTRELFFLRND